MEITIHTMFGTFIVPSNKIQDLVSWLRVHAVQANTQSVQEVRGLNNTTTQLINE